LFCLSGLIRKTFPQFFLTSEAWGDKTTQLFKFRKRLQAMANHKSAKTRIRRNERRAVINGDRMSRIRTFLKKVITAIDSGDAPAADAALREAQPELYRGVSKGVLNKKTVARKMSRLSAKIKALKTA
jgi:small subunit ribosomal protein S20